MKRTWSELKGNAEGLLYTTGKSLAEYGHVVSEEHRAMLDAALARVRAAVALEDRDELEEAIRVLDIAAHRMAEAMYRDAERALGPLEMRSRSLPRLGFKEPEAVHQLFEYLLLRTLDQRDPMQPIAAVVDRELGLASIAIDAADSTDVDDSAALLLERLRAGAFRGQYAATGLCTLAAEEQGEGPAFILELDHESGSSNIVTVTFAKRDGRHVWGQVTTREGEHSVFPLPT